MNAPISYIADEATILAELRLLLVPGVGPLTHQRLIERFGSAAEALAASSSDLRGVEGVGPKVSTAILAARNSDAAERQLAFCRQFGVEILTQTHPLFPQELREIPDPPGVLFMRGQLARHDNLAIAIVGTRHATPYGKDQAEHLAAGLSRAGFTIVSGLARGIDAVAHDAALRAGGRTIGVLGSGVLNIYPPEHDALAERVIASGAILSEYPPQSPPATHSFPQRNRIVTGMSVGVIVVEASDRSGALISARHAMEQGRDVFAVPGRVDSRMSKGCHRLIRDGAKLVESVDDVLEELGPLPAAVPREDGQGEIHHPAELKLNEQETQVLQAITSDPCSIDSVVAACGLPVQRVLSTVSVLEMRRLVRRVSGNQIMRK
ncbi:MAG TPA: DNA-processing protein DprA [Pirellulaceae bacterium]|nr:DNA-processing protein DprA [Pirellulaceae bacterium]